MSALLSAVLAMLGQLLPAITSTANAAMIDSIIAVLTSAIPFVVTEIETVGPALKNVIAALSANPATTAQQLVALQALDATTDAAFDAAAAQTDQDTAAAADAATAASTAGTVAPVASAPSTAGSSIS